MKCKDIFSVSDRKVGSATQKLEEIQLHSSYVLHTTYFILLLYNLDFHLIMTKYSHYCRAI